ncbi:hypothetical protein ACN267_31540 [Micromonospora sp. WMMD734]|uniref:hypothetical protein n=1 Tax=Micromonospora sp. WMMD734 TaxID=3404129 RepID=UPI003B94DAD6
MHRYLGAVAALLLVAMALHAGLATNPHTPGLIVLAVADLALWMAALQHRARVQGYLDGVRETVDRLAAALPKGPSR